MNDMDLIPGDYRRDRRAQRLVRHFFLMLTVAVGLVAASRAATEYLIWRESLLVVQLEHQDNIAEQNKSKSDGYRQQLTVTQQHLAALNELRGRDRVAFFLSVIESSFTDGVWFDDVHFMRSQSTGTLTSLPGAANSGIIVATDNAAASTPFSPNQRIEITGHAMSHSMLASFMEKLGNHSGVSNLRLIDTATRNYTSAQVVDFKLTVEITKAKGGA